MPTILHTEASLGFGGQELRIVAESRWLREHGWGALIACQPGSRLFAEARASATDASAVRMRGAVDLGALWALRRLMRTRGVDLVHTHSSTDSWLGALAAKSLGLPVVRVVAIPAGVDTARFHAAVSGKTVRDELRVGAGEPLIGLVANIRGS